MYEIVRVGVPARKQDATKSFYDVVDDIKLGFSVGLITSDLNSFEKLSAPYGYNYLKTELSQTIVEENLKYNTLNVFTNIWDIHGGKTPEESIDNLISYFDSQKLKKIYWDLLFRN